MMKARSISQLSLLLVCLFLSTVATNNAYAETERASERGIAITSTAFYYGGMIPREYTCDGRNISPPLMWKGVPEGTKSLALICDDPDAPAGIWVHWVLYDIPATDNELFKGVSHAQVLENGAKQGINDFRKFGYGGPCPPSGTHRYFFRIYALDTKLTQAKGLTKSGLLNAMKGHILAEGQLMGNYTR
jgi:Raf kinase inhibitor-like YbhB/YbcL family protein